MEEKRREERRGVGDIDQIVSIEFRGIEGRSEVKRKNLEVGLTLSRLSGQERRQAAVQAGTVNF